MNAFLGGIRALFEAIKVRVTTLAARDANGLTLQDDGGNTGLTVADGGKVGVGGITPYAELTLGYDAYLAWKRNPLQAGSRAFGFRQDLGVYGNLVLRSSNGADETIDTSLVAFNAAGYVGIGTTGIPTGGGASVLLIAQAGSAPTGLPSNTAGLVVLDNGGTAELNAVDESGNVTEISPHTALDIARAAGVEIDPDDPYPRVEHEMNAYAGVEAFTYFRPDGRFQRVVRELPPEQRRDWDADQRARREREIETLMASEEPLSREEAEAAATPVKPRPEIATPLAERERRTWTIR